MSIENNFQKATLSRYGKGLGDFPAGQAVSTANTLGWNVLKEDLSLPLAVLSGQRIEHNLNWMKQFIETYKVKLAPHGKTTMSPALFQKQLAHGAWGITLATAPQTQAAYHHGVRRVLLANQLVGRGNMAIIARLQQDPSFDFACIVDSPANVDQLGQFFADAGQKLKVLIELGVPGGRTGVRNEAEEDAVLAAIARWPQSLALVGIELYEGVLKEEADIRAFLQRGAAQMKRLHAEGRFAPGTIILTGAGSAWFDVVAEEWTQLDIGRPLDVVLRPGCYLTHDVGIYKSAETRIQANNPVARSMHASLLPALQVWAYVQSLPEPGLAIIALGKRDAAFDAGLPIPALHFRPGDAAPKAAPDAWKVTAMMDQHAFMQIDAGADIQIGDMIAFDISHPCLTFDKWRQLAILDEAFNVTEIVETFF
ncbi:amino acid deaminase [Andreprevotia chitinilytica]|uniref:amino acid deaminase n=1 Tax=Andreprevotia chitinilytica TaxID=396808 RepID=UPI000B14924A|nr:amino acid deaminase [Andreprevotia chitinilytica]